MLWLCLLNDCFLVDLHLHDERSEFFIDQKIDDTHEEEEEEFNRDDDDAELSKIAAEKSNLFK